MRFRAETPLEETEQMLLGTLIHAMVLEPEEVPRRFVRAEDADRRTKVGKEAWAKLLEQAGDRRLIQSGTWDLAVRVTESVCTDLASFMLIEQCRSGMIEVPLFWESNGVSCKGRPDAVLSDGTIVDLKTTSDCDPKKYRNELFRRYYHTQAAFYRRGLMSNGGGWRSHIIVAVETTAPYAVGVYRLGSQVVDSADLKIREWLDVYRECVATDRWPGYGFHEIVTPHWADGKAD